MKTSRKPYTDFQNNPFDALIEERRGTILVPSAFAQFTCRSKVNQVKLFHDHMVPGTRVITCRQDLLNAVVEFGELGISKVVTKGERGSGGSQIHLWNDLELLYALKPCKEPFVLQPYVEQYLDIRVIIVGDYIEAYCRHNARNFRNNLACGAAATPYQLSEQQISLCRKIMAWGDYPFAHLDLFLVTEGEQKITYLSEIALGGGLKGAQITLEECTKLKCEVVARRKKELSQQRTRQQDNQ